MNVWFVVLGFALAMSSFVSAADAEVEMDSQRALTGEQVYAEKRCALCHVVHGKGGKIGRDLSQVGAQRDEQWLKKFMKAPAEVAPQAKMPPFKGTADELEALVAYLRSLK
jgi:L-cysteine S-thiosulfotransferase